MAKFIHHDKIKDDPDLSDELHNKLEELYGLFAADNNRVKDLFEFIRSKFAFHYEHKADIEQTLVGAIDELPSFDMFLSKTDSANEVYAGTTEVTWRLILGKMRYLRFQGDDAELINELINLILEVTAILRQFVSKYMVEMIPAGSITGEAQMTIKVKRVCEIDLPFFSLP